MTTYVRFILIGAIAIHFMACDEQNPGWCAPGDPAEACKLTGPACSADEDCASVVGKGVCDVGGSDTCVQCTPTSKAACTGVTPACGANLQCRGCEAHAECDSDACQFGGACVAEQDVIYVKEGGTGVAPCTKAAPCGSLTVAYTQLGGNRRNIRVIGAFATETDVVGRNVAFLGDPDGTSVLKGLAAGGATPILDLSMGANVQLYGMTVADARVEGIKVSQTSELTMVRSKIVNAAREGLTLDGKATLRQVEVSSCNDPARRGIRVDDDGSLTMDRSMVSENEGGGILVLDGGQFSITNSFIVGNKATGGFFTNLPRAGSKLEFSTIVDNTAGTGNSAAGGVSCDSNGSFIRNNIIFRNVGGPNGMLQRFGSCMISGNLELAATSATDDTLKFAGTKDYHLTSASPASVKDAGGLTCPAVDFDGEARPQGTACDLGADELKAE